MSINEIRLYINALLNKDEFGGELNLQEFNLALNEYNIEFYKSKVQSLYAADASGALDYDVIYASKVLRPFIVRVTQALNSGVMGIGTLQGYAYLLKSMTTDFINGERRSVDLINHEKLFDQMTNVLAVPLIERPGAVFEGTNLIVYPTNITSIDIAYLRFPAAPVFDYFINIYDKEVFFPAGTTRTLSAGETGSLGQTTGDVTSTTVELEYTEDLHPEFLNGLLGKLGIPNRDQVILQTSMMNEQKTESK